MTGTHRDRTGPPAGPVLLIVPPFHSAIRPALGVSQLKANLEAQGCAARVLYPNLRFAERIGLDLFQWIDGHTYRVRLGEFIFSGVLFKRSDGEIERYVERVLAGSEAADHLRERFPRRSVPQVLRFLMQEASAFCDDAIEEMLDHRPWMIGFTSTFQQSCASLALMRMVKSRRPGIVTVMGGANCRSEMGEELFARFPDIDHVGQGECDDSFVSLVRALRTDGEPADLPGFLSRSRGGRPGRGRSVPVLDLDRLPYPDFGDYFLELRRRGALDRISPGLLMETSRGCWWGMRHRCTFCGLNGEDVGFRSKSASRAVAELNAQVDRYGVRRVRMTDNILDLKYFEAFFPALADHPVAELFYETSASLSRRRARLLSEAGVIWIQPGIESLSDRSLELLRKGSTATQNIQLLKWCAEFGIWVGWNHLYGLPGEREEELALLARRIEAIHHLQPPEHVTPIRLDRFSPYFDDPGRHGLAPVSPAEPYRHVYPLPEESLRRIASFYESPFFSRVPESGAFKTLEGMVRAWREAHARSYLLAIRRKTSLILIDTRPRAGRFWHRLVGARRRAYEICDRARTVAQIRGALESVGDAELATMLAEFVRARLMIRVSGRYLSLAVAARANCGKLRESASGGAIEPESRSGRALRRLFRLLTFRVPPRRVVGEIARIASSRTVSLLVRALSDPASEERVER